MKKRASKKAAAKKTTSSADFAPIVDEFAKVRGVTQKKLFSSSDVLAVGGKIFAMLVRGRLVVKLPKARVDAIIASGRGERFDPGHGRLMKEWASIDGERESWIDLAREAYHYVKG